MLERMLEQKKVIAAYSADHTITDISHYQWTIIEKLVIILTPFEELTVEHSSRNATASLIIPLISALQLFLQKVVTIDQNDLSNFIGILTMIDELLKSSKKKV